VRPHHLQAGVLDEVRHPEGHETCCEQYCVPGKTHTKRVRDYTCCFDPCTLPDGAESNGWKRVTCKDPDEVRPGR